MVGSSWSTAVCLLLQGHELVTLPAGGVLNVLSEFVLTIR